MTLSAAAYDGRLSVPATPALCSVSGVLGVAAGVATIRFDPVGDLELREDRADVVRDCLG